MLGFVQSWFAPGANPIGIDFGTDSLRLAQVEAAAGEADEFRLVAAARADVPVHLRNDPGGRLGFFAEAIRDLWPAGNFRGRRAVLSLPASAMTIEHLRVPRMDDEALKKALPWEARGKLPYDPSHAVLRHVVAGEIHQDGEQKNEVILMAARRDWVNALLAAATKAKLDVVGMNVEPKAVVDCFARAFRRKADQEATRLFVDIGCAGTRAFIARGGQILFARAIPLGGEHFTRAAAAALNVSAQDARVLRTKGCHAPSPADAAPATSPEAEAIHAACRAPAARLVDELALCRRYHEATFPALPVEQVIFLGGEARQRGLCQTIASGLDLAAQIGDPMARMGRISEVGIESGIDRRQPQPDWAVALGLSMGPAVVPAAVAK